MFEWLFSLFGGLVFTAFLVFTGLSFSESSPHLYLDFNLLGGIFVVMTIFTRFVLLIADEYF